MSTIANKHIVVAGGASGIGKALVTQLVAGHAQVTVTGRSADKLAALKAALPAISTVVLDSTDRPALNAFFESLGSIDHLVIAVSGNKGMGEFKSLSLDVVKEGFDQKFFAHLHTLQAALPYLQGSVTFITAMTATAEMPGTSGIASINGALELVVPILAKELKPLRVNAISPGVIDTPWWDHIAPEEKQQSFAYFSSLVHAGRVGRAEEVAAAIYAVLSNDYINAAIIPVTGGVS
ncbi:NAD(P)-dependent dehydrogenase, short-chain alcohol dehydrogenase family [Chitinophaga costaii]|uniref:NAD(P)-dependent dehydrogenase, short-chain alcohol dehydrogenase family n=1 Tax=Chitinophaga costaii TaxID=1335309 RepID=A0A1C4BSE1_9BACT|nr:SDR family oxidoreductase [Chitinophaga costaii]PUZ27490.1 short-chain dehydrogenase [Chitinophaga costaii]SCC09841.1 NAD(P)-dependent dehydrogenase, short-chain alcohol dehydrogenase family [Chitinophaga costaii]